MHLLKQKSAQNDSIKGELEKTFYDTLEGASKISHKKAKKLQKNVKKKMCLTL